jgi:integrase
MPSFSKYKTKQGWRWMFKMEMGNDPKTGKRKNTTRRGFKSKGEAQDVLERFKLQLKKGLINKNSDILVKDLFKKWFAHYKETSGNKPQTLKKRLSDSHRLIEEFAYTMARKVTHFDYQEFILDLKREHDLEKSTIKNIHAVGHMMFSYAKKEKIVQESPADEIDMPSTYVSVEKVKDVAKRFFELDEIDPFLRAAQEVCPDDIRRIFFCMIWTGLRPGEILALEKNDLDQEQRLLDISRTHVNDIRGLTTVPKTASSIRTIMVEPEVVEAIKEQLAVVEGIENKYLPMKNNQLIFPRLSGPKIGERYQEQTLNYYIQKVIAHAGIDKHITPHKLRHTHVSLCAESGVSLEDIKARVGHHDDKITEAIYMHVTKNRRKNMSTVFGDYMRNRDKK